ncbi:MAG: glycine zipper family protein [Pseudomonadota bacterium]
MTAIRLLFVTVATAALAACAANPNPIIDRKGVDPELLAQDWEECEVISKEVNVPTGVAKGAGVGAAVGTIAGAIGSGDKSEGAGFGALWGGTRSGLDAKREQSMVFKRCMKGRGYRVLN